MAKKKPGKSGRPLLPKDRVRKVVTLRLLLEEKAQFERVAQLERLTVSQWMRKVLRAEVDRQSSFS